MENNLKIKAYCNIKDNQLSLNGKTILSDNKNLNFKEFSKAMYRGLNMKHAKFFKMDNLSKLAILASEVLLSNYNNKSGTGIILSNNAASLETDRKHQESISDANNYFPSPAVFVYTLPNICIGEISIKHQIKGENAFFVSSFFNTKLIMQYTSSLIKNNKSPEVLCGWVNFDNDQYEAFMYLVALDGEFQHTEQFINTIYNNTNDSIKTRA